MIKKIAVVVDFNSILYTNCHAFLDITNSQGIHVGGIFGFINHIFSILRIFKTDLLFFALEGKENRKGFRYQLHPDYKSKRDIMPDFVINQLYWIKNIFEAANVNFFSIHGWEADDTIASLSTLLSKNGFFTVISSRDKDLLQLVQDDKIIVFSKGKIFNSKGVISKFNVLPTQIIDYLALIGDSSDAIPGVANIGPKTAVKLLSEYKDIETIYQNLDSISPSIKKKLFGNLEKALLYKTIIKLNCDLIQNEELAPLFSNRFTWYNNQKIRNYMELLELNIKV